ncbi:MAG: hypothetical protein ACWGMZ_06595, partial [Thermoguttaceae bacterium]
MQQVGAVVLNQTMSGIVVKQYLQGGIARNIPARISHQMDTSQNSVPLLRRSSAFHNRFTLLALRQAVAHLAEK